MQIQNAKTPREVFNIAQANKQHQRADWYRVNIDMVCPIIFLLIRTVLLIQRYKMDIALLHKFQQHRSLKNLLLSTGDAELVEVNTGMIYPIMIADSS